LLLALAVIAVHCGPALPSCPHTQCVYLWVANYVPSPSYSQFNFYVDDVAIRTALDYGFDEIIPVSCNSSQDSVVKHYSIAPTVTLAQAPITQQNDVTCGHLWSFFATRAPNVGGVEKYSFAIRLLEGNSLNNYMSGFFFNGIFNGGNVNAQYCDYNNANCDVNNLNQRTNKAATLGVWNEMTLRMEPGYQNPVRITGPNGVVLFDDVVTGSIGDARTWAFYGDNNNQNNFPIRGGVSPASFLTISMSVLVALSAIVTLML